MARVEHLIEIVYALHVPGAREHILTEVECDYYAFALWPRVPPARAELRRWVQSSAGKLKILLPCPAGC